jgi:hypothetical protein
MKGLKGWPFESAGGVVVPLGEGSGGSPCPHPG